MNNADRIQIEANIKGFEKIIAMEERFIVRFADDAKAVKKAQTKIKNTRARLNTNLELLAKYGA